MPRQPEKERDWDRSQMAPDLVEGEALNEANQVPATPGDAERWTKTQWVGEDVDGHRPEADSPEEMPEGESGLTGSRHNPGVEDWASDSSTKR